MIDDVFSRAVVAYLGEIGHVDPRPPEDRVVAGVGADGADLVPRIRLMLDDLYSTQPPLWDSENIADVGRRASAWMHDRYPELSDAAVQSVSRHFSFGWK